MAIVLCVLRWLKSFFLQKPHTKNAAQKAKVLVFHESANNNVALNTYLRLTLDGNYVGWAKVRALSEYSIFWGYHKAVEVGAGAITRLKSLE